ncbi:TetR/AcrR family transcriptional regulator [Egicoccus halophilus]|uniref:Transcriptional regulator n=1 Tax=Egicoccus halophilus TaxID=1670830 RepID=A0A8J3A8V8_9ACTN|nr:TetR/AcrR family transcriptional regulator [Egicoccus halophilus]GGI07015.1 transcriptional regulator [Egicoccus halophilus]
MTRTSVVAARREQILGATCEVAAEVGFRSLRVTDVAQRVGCSSGTVHYYFATKRALIRAAFEHNFQASLARRAAILDSDGDAVVRLRSLIASYLPESPVTVEAWKVWAELWVGALHDPDLRELNDVVYGAWRSRVAEIIAEGQRDGTMQPGDPQVLANAVIGLIDGLSIQVLLESRSLDVLHVHEVCDLILRSAVLVPGAEASR